jgi:hypothetical protein
MAQEIDEGVSHLKVLQQSTSANEATAETPPTNNGAEKGWQQGSPEIAANQFCGPEKRRSTRYPCDGSAGMRAEGTDLQTWAKFTNVSLHGCYIEQQATYPVGTILHLKLDAKGTHVENKGCVRVSYPLGMGVSFVEATEETRGRLKQMLGSLARPILIAKPGVAPALPVLLPRATLPSIANPTAAVLALFEFFEKRLTLSREDFRRILHKSQDAFTKK